MNLLLGSVNGEACTQATTSPSAMIPHNIGQVANIPLLQVALDSWTTFFISSFLALTSDSGGPPTRLLHEHPRIKISAVKPEHLG